MAFGALFIKERLGTSDRETVEQIKENPYLQYFIGPNTLVDRHWKSVPVTIAVVTCPLCRG